MLEYEYPASFTRRTLATAQGVNVVFGCVRPSPRPLVAFVMRGLRLRANGSRSHAHMRSPFSSLPFPRTIKSVTRSSSVYLDAPDLDKHPELPKATPYKVRLRPGSVLYLPSYWHHEVKSHPDEKEGLNLAINYWFRNETSFAEEAQGLAAAARHKQQRKKQQHRQAA